MEFLLIHGYQPPFRIGSILYQSVFYHRIHTNAIFCSYSNFLCPDECKKSKPVWVTSLPFGSSRLDAARTGFRSVSGRFLDLDDHRLFRTPNGHRNPCSTVIHEFLPPFVLMNQLHITPEDCMNRCCHFYYTTHF